LPKSYKILLFFLIAAKLQSQELLPFVENFTKSEYRGDNQVWNVVQGLDKAMYFANNHYLLRYNGVGWEKNTLPNKTIIRSILADGDRIYCGSYKEFGYWKRISGRMQYFSLSVGQPLFQGVSDNEEIWKMFRLGSNIYFQSFNELLVYDGNAIKKLRFPALISYCYIVDGQVYAASVRNGVWILNGDTFIPKHGWDKLKENVIHHIEKLGSKTFVFTKNNGIFVDDGRSLEPWNNPLNAQLMDQVIITAKVINSQTIAIGTALQGLYIVNLHDGSWRNINRQNSLKNNAVLSIATDQEQDIWLGLDNGISHIEINSPVSIFLDNSGLLGSVYSLSPIPGGYIFATNHGLFTSKNKKLAVVNDSQGQVWDIFPANNSFLIGHNDGTGIYNGNFYRNVNPINGGWKFLNSKFDQVHFQASYSGISVYPDKHDFSKWKTLEGLTKPIRNIAQEKSNEIWAADNYRGLYRVCYNNSFETTKIENVSVLSGISNDYGVRIFENRRKVLFLIDNHWYHYNRAKAKLEYEPTFNNIFKNISDIIPIDDSHFMVVRGGLLYLITISRDNYLWKLIPEKYYQGKIIIENIKVFRDHNRLLINLDDGFLAFNLGKNQLKLPKVILEAFSHGQLISNGSKIKYNESIDIHAIPVFFGFNRPDLLYRLNDSPLFGRVNSGRISLNNLESGDQRLGVFYNDGTRLVKIGDYKFAVGSPWYFSFGMIVFYLFFFALVCYLYYRWNSLRYRQKLALKEEELKHQNDILELKLSAENELRIQEYEKHILELEIRSKSSEVAGKSFSIAKQSEIMDSIRKILDNANDLNSVKSEIERAIRVNSINKHEWEAFQTNMKQIHSDFVTGLLLRHPELSPKDIRLAIHLKMNLSSKEIAPLMNISFRGVELHRYRLRKKLNLAQDVNLNKYMLEI
jgi:AraC family chitin signaling transcriptional activator